MNDDVGRAEEVVEYLRQRLATENLTATFELPLYEHPCGVAVDFPSGDGLQLEVSEVISEVRVMDPVDFALTVTELGDYVAMRARGVTSKDALKAVISGHRRTGWWRRWR
ncbi:hypothetical protein ACGFJT_09015 [Actinomadura geliboluensis]|uniref:hypothetical protein n=1 Tax=Actinomadura geliboluensis TaxID=882440 RepID=UPI003716FF12